MNKEFEKILDMLKDTAKIEIQLHCGRCNGKTFALGYKKGIENAIKIVQEVAEEYKGGWIPCSERLPDIEADVLLTLRSLDIYTGFRANTDGYFYVEGTDDGYIPFENVIAWQQLPKPFKEEKNE